MWGNHVWVNVPKKETFPRIAICQLAAHKQSMHVKIGYVSSMKKHMNEDKMSIYWTLYIVSHLTISTLLQWNEKINDWYMHILSLCQTFIDAHIIGQNPHKFLQVLEPEGFGYAWVWAIKKSVRMI